MPIYALGDLSPTIASSAFVHPDAVIIGNVTLGEKASVWPGAVLRGDHGSIRIGDSTSIQDGSIIHCSADFDTVIGSRCVVGHRVHIEGAVIEDGCLIASGSVVLPGVIVRSGAIVGAGAVVSPGTEVPACALALGVPARMRLNAADQEAISHAVSIYERNVSWYSELRRIN